MIPLLRSALGGALRAQTLERSLESRAAGPARSSARPECRPVSVSCVLITRKRPNVFAVGVNPKRRMASKRGGQMGPGSAMAGSPTG
jgi:hypothetical protein